MSLDPRLQSLLQREFATIKLAAEPEFLRSLRHVGNEFSRGTVHQTDLVRRVDRECADLYSVLGHAYLARLLQRATELGEPWTPELQAESSALLRTQLTNDWNWLTRVRDNSLPEPLRPESTGQITHAQNVAFRQIEEELEARVLRQDRRQLPLLELLKPPRYEPVRRHFMAAHEAAVVAARGGEQDVARESIFAVEALARLATNEPAKTLGGCLRVLEQRTDDAGRRLLRSVEEIWNFSNVAASVRHGGGSGDNVTAPEAQYVLGVTDAALRLLLVYDRA